MTWWSVEVDLSGADPSAVATRLVVETGHAVEERPARVVGFAADRGAAARAGAAITAAFGPSVTVRHAEVAEVDWSLKWREGLRVHRIGRLAIGPSWLLEPGPLAVVIDPETAFGSGEHGSTRGALRLLDRWLAPGALVLDLGSGSGVLAIAAAKLGARAVLGIELDDDAVPVAEDNARRNGVADRVRFLTGDARVLAGLAGPADLIVANILRVVNETLVDPIRGALAPGGVAVFAGMEEDDAPGFRGLVEARGFRVVLENLDEGWWSAAAVVSS